LSNEIVSEGKGVRYVNTASQTMKIVAIKMIKANRPVFFGSDVGKFSDRALGVIDTDLYNYALGFNLSLNMTKAERIHVGSSAMTHAMVLTGVDLDEQGNPVRWRVENSWGKDAGKDGYFLMSDKWFDEYVYQIVCHFSDAPRELVDVFKAGNPIALKPWDPMVQSICFGPLIDFRVLWLVVMGIVQHIAPWDLTITMGLWDTGGLLYQNYRIIQPVTQLCWNFSNAILHKGGSATVTSLSREISRPLSPCSYEFSYLLDEPQGLLGFLDGRIIRLMIIYCFGWS
jgi:Peptidase C1-like family